VYSDSIRVRILSSLLLTTNTDDFIIIRVQSSETSQNEFAGRKCLTYFSNV